MDSTSFNRPNRNPRGPRVMRIAAATLAVLLVAVACDNGSQSDDTTRDDSGAVQEGGDVGVFRLQVGDCLNDDIVTEQSSIPVVPCDEPHDSQIYAAFDLSGSEFPGTLTVESESQDGCLERFEEIFGPYEASPYFFGYLYPTEDSWNEINDREVLCVASTGETMTEDILPAA